MSIDTVCRLCLTIDAPMHNISKGPLQGVYEKFTDSPLNAAHRPTVACYLCYSQLKKCHNLMVKAVRADTVLTRILESGKTISKESIALFNTELYQLNNSLSITPIRLITITGPDINLVSLIEINIDKSPTYHNEGVEMETSVSVEHLKVEELENEGDTVRVEATDMQDIEIEPINTEEFVETEMVEIQVPANIDEFVESDAGEYIGKESEGFAPYEYELSAEDRIFLEKLRAVIEKEEQSTVGTYVLGSTDKTVDNNEIPTSSETAKNQVIVTDNSDSRVGAPVLRSAKNAAINTELHPTNTSLIRDMLAANSDDYNSDNRFYIHNSRSNFNIFICNDCGIVYTNKRHLIQHMEKHAVKLKPDSVPLTKLLKPKTPKLLKPRFSRKVDIKKGSEPQKPVECMICQKRFTNKHGLGRHFRIHTGERRYKCHVCKVRFKQRGHLKIHLRTHTGERPFQCEVCKVSFVQKAHLDKHLTIHNDERPFECGVCKQTFKRKEHFTLHYRIHTGEKPYECPFCQARFTLKPTLTSHVRTHTGEKPFECKICQQRFNQRSDVKKHMRVHTGEKPFECVICQRIFSIKGNLTKHLLTHTKERPFKCELCHQRFRRKDHLAYHERTHNGE